MNLKVTILSEEKNPHEKGYILGFHLCKNSIKCIPICCDTKQISGCLGKAQGMITKNHEETLLSDEYFLFFFIMVISHVPKLHIVYFKQAKFVVCH